MSQWTYGSFTVTSANRPLAHKYDLLPLHSEEKLDLDLNSIDPKTNLSPDGSSVFPPKSSASSHNHARRVLRIKKGWKGEESLDSKSLNNSKTYNDALRNFRT